MVPDDDLLYVSLAKRRCNKHIIRHRKYAALEKGRTNRTAVMLSKLHIFPLNRCFGELVFFFFFFPLERRVNLIQVQSQKPVI